MFLQPNTNCNKALLFRSFVGISMGKIYCLSLFYAFERGGRLNDVISCKTVKYLPSSRSAL